MQELIHEPTEAGQQGDRATHHVVDVFPNDDAVLRLVGAILAEQHDEWKSSDRRYLTVNCAPVLELK